MPSSNKIINLTSKQPNDHANNFIRKCQELLSPNIIPFISPAILPRKQTELEEAAGKISDAKIVVHSDMLGATVLSSTGSITIIGKQEVKFNKIDYNSFGRHRIEQVNSEYNYAVKEIGKILTQTGVNKDELEELDKALPHVVIIKNEKSNEIIIADALGHSNIFKSPNKSTGSNR